MPRVNRRGKIETETPPHTLREVGMTVDGCEWFARVESGPELDRMRPSY